MHIMIPSIPSSRRFAALAVGLVLVAMGPAGRAHAAPPVVPIEGFLTDADGEALDQTGVELLFRLYTAEEGGELLFTEQALVRPKAGYFQYELGSNDALDLSIFRDHEEIYLGLTIGTDEEASPRMALGSVPFAGFAEHAGDALTVGGRSIEALQTRLEGACDGNSALQGYSSAGVAQCAVFAGTGSCLDGEYLYGFDDTGAPRCRQNPDPPTGDITGVTASFGLSGGGGEGDVSLSIDPTTVQRRIADACGAGEYMYGLGEDGSPMCRVDDIGGDITSVVAGPGLAGGGGIGDVELSLQTVAPEFTISFFSPVPVVRSVTPDEHGPWTTVVEQTIEAPAAGHVLVLGVAYSASNNSCGFGVCQPEPMNVTAGIAVTAQGDPGITFGHSTGDAAMHSVPTHVTQAFPVAAGPRTFYLKLRANKDHPDEDGVTGTGAIQLVFLPGA